MASALTEAFIDLIQSGQVDDDLATIENSVRMRMLSRGTRAVGSTWLPGAGYAVGDRVITTVIRPKYLEGQRGTLTRFKLKRWAFKPDNPSVFGRFLEPDGTTGLTPNMFRKE